MPWAVKYLFILGLLGALNACTVQQDNGTFLPSKLIEGQAFPAFTLTSLEGNKTAFNPLQDKVIIFNVWGTWCPPCRKEMPSLQRLKQKLDTSRFELVLMAMDEYPMAVREYLIDKKLTLTTFIDTNLSITKNILDLKVYPTTFIIDRQGDLKHIIAGEKEWDQAEVIQFLEGIYTAPKDGYTRKN